MKWRALVVGAVLWSPGASQAPAQEVDLSRLEIVEGLSGLSEEPAFIHIAGEVRNGTGEWVLTPRVIVELLDASGQPIRVDSIAAGVAEDAGWEPHEFTFSKRTYIPPGGVGVFYYVRDAAKLGSARYASHRLRLASARRAENPPQVEIDALQTTMRDDVRVLTGRIRNRGHVGCYSPRVIVGVYGPDGTLLREEHETPEATFQTVLEGGRSVPFRLVVYPDTGLGGEIGRLEAWADCVEPY